MAVDSNEAGFGDGKLLTGQEFLDALQANGYVIGSGQTIVLHSCLTGQSAGTRPSFAQWLANAVNANVIAPDNFLGVGLDPSGNEVNRVIGGGQFWLFSPEQIATTAWCYSLTNR